MRAVSRWRLQGARLSGSLTSRSYLPEPKATPSKLYEPPVAGRPLMAILLDGNSQAYIDEAVKADVMPFWKDSLLREKQKACWGLWAGVLPSSTLANLAGIMTGVTPNKHGVVDGKQTGALQLQCASIPSFLSSSSLPESQRTKIYAVSAHSGVLDMLRSEVSNLLSLHETAGPNEQITPTLRDKIAYNYPSLYPLRIATRLLTKDYDGVKKHSSLIIVHLLDEVHHYYQPGAPEANDFYQALDRELKAIDKQGAIIGLTSCHGMNPKVGFKGKPKTVFVGDVLKEANIDCTMELHVDCQTPHHKDIPAGMASVYLEKDNIDMALKILRQINGLYGVFNRQDACQAFDLPANRLGDIVLLGDLSTGLAFTDTSKDLPPHTYLHPTAITPSNTHGSLQETTVPVWFNTPLKPDYQKLLTTGRARNFQLFDFLFNGTDPDKTTLPFQF
eukprot:gb/GEZN01008441.1/.p1 GENE.gb/GEZN01008441.1/~~gb/GEZN01008441.1/.p1  ORF type:complete len:446 (-),score=53.16 gb/GEZN01008441.1/:25-1362(-)